MKKRDLKNSFWKIISVIDSISIIGFAVVLIMNVSAGFENGVIMVLFFAALAFSLVCSLLFLIFSVMVRKNQNKSKKEKRLFAAAVLLNVIFLILIIAAAVGMLWLRNHIIFL